MGDALEHADLGTIPLIRGFITVTGVVGLLIVGVIPKWALLAPIFVPLFMKLGVAPEAVLAAYRVADSPSNVGTPLMPYFALIVVSAQRYDKTHGGGDDAALRGGGLGRVDPAVSRLRSARAPVGALVKGGSTLRGSACGRRCGGRGGACQWRAQRLLLALVERGADHRAALALQGRQDLVGRHLAHKQEERSIS
jgi:hypothetical protein